MVANVKLASLLAFGVFSAAQMIIHSVFHTKQWLSTPETIGCLIGMVVSLAAFFITHFLQMGIAPSTPRRSLNPHRSKPHEDKSHAAERCNAYERRD